MGGIWLDVENEREYGKESAVDEETCAREFHICGYVSG